MVAAVRAQRARDGGGVGWQRSWMEGCSFLKRWEGNGMEGRNGQTAREREREREREMPDKRLN